MSTLLTIAEALAHIAALSTPLAAEDMPLALARGRVVARDIPAPIDLPRFDNSQMDGYAVRLESADLIELPGPREWRIVGAIPAGRSAEHLSLHTGEAARVFTGSALPEGADAVVMQEVTEWVEPARIRILAPVTPGQFIRRTGSDVTAGTIVLERGTVLRPAAIGLLTTLGLTQVTVHRAPRVALFSSGDELVAPGETPAAHQLIEGNTTMLAAGLGELGLTPMALERAPDEREAIEERLQHLLDTCDVLLISGGVSVGDHDHIRPALEALGAEVVFWRVAQRPGKPLLCAHRGHTLILGLPGNPTSTLACFYLYAWPLLRGLLGHRTPGLPQRFADLQGSVRGIEGLEQLLRGRIDFTPYGGARVTALEGQGSHQLHPFVRANCLIHLPCREGSFAAGESVACLVLPGTGE